jgi:hypothetical protein
MSRHTWWLPERLRVDDLRTAGVLIQICVYVHSAQLARQTLADCAAQQARSMKEGLALQQ